MKQIEPFKEAVNKIAEDVADKIVEYLEKITKCYIIVETTIDGDGIARICGVYESEKDAQDTLRFYMKVKTGYFVIIESPYHPKFEV